MRIIVGVVRMFVGILFIISGLIKLNDPVGFSFKLKEYFTPDVLDLEFLVPYAILIAIFVVIFEVLLGVMVIVGYAKRFTLWSLLLMIVFFTFLTFYSAYFNKVTDCGCFGDALKLTPWESFYKDIVLLVLILILFLGKHYIQPFFAQNVRSLVVFVSFIICLGITYQVLQHLPIIDFRPYKIGANIPENMTIPPDAPKPIFEYQWKFLVNGEEKIITTNGEYPQQEGEFISVETKEIQAGYVPPIHDFTIERNEQDYTAEFMEVENLIVIVAYNMESTEKDGYLPIKEITDEALKKGYKVIGLSASSENVTDRLVENYKLNFRFYFCDETTLKTIVRSNPGILELQKGTVTQKLHWNDAHKLKLETLDTAIPTLNFGLKVRLDSIAVLNNKYRQLQQTTDPEERKALGESLGFKAAEYNGDLAEMQRVIDSMNMIFIETIFAKNGYPGKSVVGEPTHTVAFEVLQNNPDKIETYLPLIKKAAKAGELPKTMAALMEDQYLMNNGAPQLYGTQGSFSEELGNFIWPITKADKVNERREKAGFTTTVEAYAKELFGPDFEYKALTLQDINQ